MRQVRDQYGIGQESIWDRPGVSVGQRRGQCGASSLSGKVLAVVITVDTGHTISFLFSSGIQVITYTCSQFSESHCEPNICKGAWCSHQTL